MFTNRQDHHCPWINNCVGHFNHGHFIRFLFFVDIACSYHAIMVTRRVMDAMNSSYWVGLPPLFWILTNTTHRTDLRTLNLFLLFSIMSPAYQSFFQSVASGARPNLKPISDPSPHVIAVSITLMRCSEIPRPLKDGKRTKWQQWSKREKSARCV